MLNLARMLACLIVIAAFALCATHAVDARSHRRAVTPVATPAKPKPANVPEQNRDPADVALDRRIKGICRGC
jgi:hypothetical protein